MVDKTVDLFRIAEQEGAEVSDERRKEIQANQFAAALLMPADLVSERYKTITNLEALARIFNVSEQAMGIRVTTIGLD